MKKAISIILLIFSTQAFSQCGFSDIFPFNIGENKFEVTRLINSNSSMSKIAQVPAFEAMDNRWEKCKYNKNDSIYRVEIGLYHIKDKCLNGNENRIFLGLVDDRLCRIEVDQVFSKDRYDEMIANYKKYINIFIDMYPIDETCDVLNYNTHEKIGKGINFYRVLEEKEKKIKLEEISISYNVIYKLVYNSENKKFVRTSEVDYYKIEIINLNLKGTKLTSQGY